MLTAQSRRANGGSGERHFSTAAHSHSNSERVALQVFKRNKLCTVAKLTQFYDDDELILAIAHDKQHGVKSTISVPFVVLDYADARNVRTLYFRRDTTGEMYCIPLAELRKIGVLQQSDGVLERFIRIAQMQPCQWRRWHFATSTTVLATNRAQHDEPQQLALI